MRRAMLLAGPLMAIAACSGRGSPAAIKTEAVLHASVVGTSGTHRYADHYTLTTGPHGAPDCHAATVAGNSSLHQFVVGAPGSRAAPLYFGFQTRVFTGPGAYGPARVRLDSVAAVIARRSVEFRRVPTSVVSLTVHPDGSGIARFGGFRAADGTELAAVVTWTCATVSVRV